MRSSETKVWAQTCNLMRTPFEDNLASLTDQIDVKEL